MLAINSMKSIEINQIIFNNAWDSVVGNTVNQSLGTIKRTGSDLYISYLCNSLRNLQATHNLKQYRIRIWLVMISEYGMKERELKEAIRKFVPYIDFETFVIPHSRISPYINNARLIPDKLYKSPNELHEFLLFLIVRLSSAVYTVIYDPDILFYKKDALEIAVETLKKSPESWVAGFLESRVKRPFGGRFIHARERLHTVFLIFDSNKFKRGFMDTTDWSPDSLTKAENINSAECVEYYTKYKFFDTLSVFTDYLKFNFSINRLLSLNEYHGFIESHKLTIVSDILIHCKYLQNCTEYIEEILKKENYAPSKVTAIRKQLSDIIPIFISNN